MKAPALADELDTVVDRIDRTHADLRAFVEEAGRADRVRRLAREIEERWPDPEQRPVLYGVPLAVKDVFRVDGLPTRAGSKIPEHELAGPESPAVTQLREAGTVVIGKSETTEFAFFAPGPTRNPHHRNHTPGGSSSGSAAAVAAGLVPLALGTQTVGSIGRPAAYCGCLGFKPTYGRAPTDGVIPNAPTFDTVGLFASDLPLLTAAAGVLCDDWTAAVDVRHPVLGVPSERYLHQATPPARKAFEAQLAALRTAGYQVRETSFLHDIEEINRRHLVVNLVELALSHAAWFDRYGERYQPETAEAIRDGRTVGADTYDAALYSVHAFRNEVPAVMADVGIDVWVSPAATGPAPRGLGSTGSPLMNLPWTQAGLPALVLPVGTAAAPHGPALPIGLQCAGRPGADELLLAQAAGIGEALAVYSSPTASSPPPVASA